MSARILDGKAIAKSVREDVARRAAELTARGTRPGLVVVLVGEDPASHVYVKNKDKAALEAGFSVRTVRKSAAISQAELLTLVRELNADASVHGILVQLPLPKSLDANAVVRAIDPAKDVDGLHPDNVARLALGDRGLFPCTPRGCIEICDRSGIPLAGKRAAVVGRSMLVGKPLALMLLARDVTVTMCHSRTTDLPSVTREADLVFAAVGKPELVRGDWIRPGATVIDVGINRLGDGRLVGDVAFGEALERAGAITPVPGGVGPMTIAMLLDNTVIAAARAAGVESSPPVVAAGKGA
ncbi:MAG: bifunctional methylenetetrahydrofolate dehydrogenase/methenyltetrahydrofolate cyclohydrolase FolD [Planctomycetes bacterium]|nr:bifunctional methylenetetrahydrofolate dehydrogenase/methenyltetrahydrofolate cyclohydrolase FolD [Planctomycetota bacterium]